MTYRELYSRILDALNEIAIRFARRHFLRYPTRANVAHLQNLINARSPQQVARMERAKGLDHA